MICGSVETVEVHLAHCTMHENRFRISDDHDRRFLASFEHRGAPAEGRRL
jgi:hypothetical protein